MENRKLDHPVEFKTINIEDRKISKLREENKMLKLENQKLKEAMNLMKGIVERL